MTDLITGASGHIGANLVRALIAKGRPPRCLIHINTRALDGLDVEKITGDIRDLDSLNGAFKGVDTVYHLAGHISITNNGWEDLKETNILGTRNIVTSCLKNGIRRLVYFSSIHAFKREPVDRPVDETNPLVNGENNAPYDRSKAAGEKEVRRGIEEGLDAVILNPTSVIGPYDFQLSHMGEALLLMAQGKLPALIEGGFDWVDVRDVVEGAIQAEKLAPLGAKYLLSGQYATIRDLARLTEELIGTPPPRFVAPQWLVRTGAPALTAYSRLTRNRQLYTGATIRALSRCNHNISHERATRELNYQPRPLRSTLRDIFQWFQEAGWLDLSKFTKKGK